MINNLDFSILKRTLKVLGPLVIGLSIMKQTIYYWSFGVNIWNYVGLDELLTPIVSDLTFYCLTIFIPTIILLVFVGEQIGNNNITQFENIRSSTFIKRVWLSIKYDYLFMSNLFLLFFCLFLKKGIWEIFLYTGISIMVFIVFFLRQEILIKYNVGFTKRNSTMLNISNIVIIVFIYTIWNCLININRIKNETGKEVNIITQTENIYCKYSKNYVGRTKNYTFIYNKKTEKTEVIVNSTIVKEKIEN